ncbi:MAG: T9SS type A sorting domain-containing protein [Paludibacter sp.]|nr:T9SS type A sorting domain-containing protein [Paludibacter sp.]
MKKITLLLIATVALCWANSASAGSNTLVPTYFVNESFTGATTYPTGWSVGTALYAGSGAISWTSPASDQLSSSGSGTGNRGYTINFPGSGTETTVYLNFDWFITAQSIGQRNATGLLLHGSGATTTDPQNIICLYNCGSGGFFYLNNLQKDSTTFLTGGNFNRATNISIAGTSTRNSGCNTNLALATSTWYNIKAKLNFTTHMIDSITISKKSDATVNVTFTALNFLNATANDLSKISFTSNRSNNSGTNGNNSNFNFSIDNFKTYKLTQATTSTVTVNYLDPSNVAFKTARTVTDLTVASTYTALSSDKATYTDGSYYYIYDATNTISDNTVVAADGSSVINLKFKKVDVATGTYTWTGLTSSNWSDVDANFTTDGVNSFAYQSNNPIIFPATATMKSAILTGDLTLGSNNINLSGDGYALTGTGSVSGTGALNLNLNAGETATIGIKNNLTGGLVVNGGIAVVTNDLGTSTYTVADGTKLKLQTGAAFSKAIAGTGTVTIEAASNVFYTQAITGASTVNIILDNAGSSSSTWSDYWGGSLPSGAQINVTTGLAAAGFGVGDALLTNNKVNLGDGVRLLRWYNQSTSGGGTSTIVVGELNGTAGSTIEGGMVDASNRMLAYEIGALNTDATFAGVIKNYLTVTTAPLNVYKKGTGTWTLTGASTYSPGLFNVDAGKVILTGALNGAAVPVLVAAGATLAGTGTIGSATTVAGTLEGKLNFGSSLTLAGTTNITGTGFDAGSFDVINVTGAVVNGGVLNVSITAAEPTAPLTIKLINAGSYSGTFSAVNVITPVATNSSAWGYNNATGELTYYPLGTGVQSLKSTLSVYPTITNNSIQINGQNISAINIVNLMGQSVKQINTTATTNTISLSGLSTGAYYVKVKSTDGSVTVSKIIYQK